MQTSTFECMRIPCHNARARSCKPAPPNNRAIAPSGDLIWPTARVAERQLFPLYICCLAGYTVYLAAISH